MVWDKDEPQNTTKIRNLGTVIRPNWDAIEGGSTSFQPDAFILTDRTALGVGDNPAAAVAGGTSRGNGYTLFCKQDDASVQQLYAISPAGVINQLTQGAATLNTTGQVFVAGGIKIQWDTVTKKDGDAVTFPVPFDSTPYVVVANETTGGAANFDFIKPNTFTATQFTLTLLKANGDPQTSARTLNYIAIGPA